MLAATEDVIASIYGPVVDLTYDQAFACRQWHRCLFHNCETTECERISIHGGIQQSTACGASSRVITDVSTSMTNPYGVTSARCAQVRIEKTLNAKWSQLTTTESRHVINASTRATASTGKRHSETADVTCDVMTSRDSSAAMTHTRPQISHTVSLLLCPT